MILTDGVSLSPISFILKLTLIFRCEYILYRGLYRTSYARVSRGIITDTELQIGQFVLPKHGHNTTNDSVEARYLRSRKEDMPEDHASSSLYSSGLRIYLCCSGSQWNTSETRAKVESMVTSIMYSIQ